MNRRGFLQGMLALAAAPAIVRASSLMPIRVIDEPLILWGDGIHDDTRALQALLDGKPVDTSRTGASAAGGIVLLTAGEYLVSNTIDIPDGAVLDVRGCAFDVAQRVPVVFRGGPTAHGHISDCYLTWRDQ